MKLLKPVTYSSPLLNLQCNVCSSRKDTQLAKYLKGMHWAMLTSVIEKYQSYAKTRKYDQLCIRRVGQPATWVVDHSGVKISKTCDRSFASSHQIRFSRSVLFSAIWVWQKKKCYHLRPLCGLYFSFVYTQFGDQCHFKWNWLAMQNFKPQRW